MDSQTFTHSIPDSGALAPKAIARLSHLTREYARLSRDHGGLASLLGGTFLLLAAAVEAAGYGQLSTWRQIGLGAFAALPLWVGLGLILLPLAWMTLRKALSVYVQREFGAVAPLIEDVSQLRLLRIKNQIGRVILPLLMLMSPLALLHHPLPHAGLRVLLITLLALGLGIFLPSWKGRVERMVGILLFITPLWTLAGLRMGAGDTLLAFPIIGAVSVIRGMRDHRAFRRVVGELREQA